MGGRVAPVLASGGALPPERGCPFGVLMDPVVLFAAIIAAVATSGLIAYWVIIGSPGGPARRGVRARRSAGFDDATDVVDRSVGMYLVRRLTGRPTSAPPEVVEPPVDLSVDEVAYRIGVADAPVPPPVVQPTAPLSDAAALSDAAVLAAAARAAAAGHAEARAAAAAPSSRRGSSPAARAPGLLERKSLDKHHRRRRENGSSGTPGSP